AVAAAVLIGYALRSLAPLPNVSLIFLLAVLFPAVSFGMWPAIYASFLSFLAYNFFFIHPIYTSEDTPRVDEPERVQIEPLGKTFSRVLLRFGFMETPSVPKALAIARRHGWHFDIMSTSFFLSRRTLKPTAASGMARWQNRLFIALARSANDATD